MDLLSAVLNLALILPLPSISSLNLGQESHEGTRHCGSPRPQPPHVLRRVALGSGQVLWAQLQAVGGPADRIRSCLPGDPQQLGKEVPPGRSMA